MQQINETIEYLKNISHEKIIDIFIAVGIIIFFCFFSSIISYLIIKLFMRKEKNKEIIKSNAFYMPIKVLFILMGLHLGVYILDLPPNIMIIWEKIVRITIICMIAKGIINLANPKSALVQKLMKKDMTNQEKTMQRFGGRILKWIVYIIAGVFILKEFDYDISGLMAGLGIASAIVALAAQDIVKSLISGMSIITEKPFLVGDWIEVGNIAGTVIDISIRTTKIKTNDNTIVSIENGVITSSSIINWARIETRRYEFNLKLPLETNSDIIENIISRIRFTLQNIDTVQTDTINVYFNTIMSDGINIIGYLYTSIVDYAEYLEFRQEVNSAILKILESENIKLAYPGENVHIIQSN